MVKECSPAFQFYPGDFLSDSNVQMMTMEEEGCYIHLMCLCWREGFVPTEEGKLKLLCKGVSPSELVLSCFYRTAIADGSQCDVLRHKRLDKEREKQAEFRALKSRAGEIGNKKRWGNRKKTKQLIASGSQCDNSAIANGSQTIALLSSSLSLHINNENSPNGHKDGFDKFEVCWMEYPAHRRDPETIAFDAWARLNPDLETAKAVMRGIVSLKESEDPKYIPGFSKFLDSKGWVK